MSGRYTLHLGDCLDAMREMPARSVDAVVTDPPYGLGFMGKAFDTFKAGDIAMRRNRSMDAVNAGQSRQGGRQRQCADYAKRQARDMLAYQEAMLPIFEEALRVAKPGAHLLAFGGTRTYHRLACAIEDAGWEIRDSIHWVYGSGFPKSLNIGGGLGTALKPAHEPIILARKPLDGTVARNVLKHGCGALNIDASRVATDAPRPHVVSNRRSGNGVYRDGLQGSKEIDPTTLGRWPANLIHDGSPEVVRLFPVDSKTATGVKKISSGKKSGAGTWVGTGMQREGAENTGIRDHGDSGSAARFFQACEPDPDPVVYCAKASRADRNGGGVRSTHPTVKPTSLMRYLCRLVTPPGGIVLDPFMGSGSTGKAAILDGFRFVGIEREAEYMDIARARIAAAVSDCDATPDPGPQLDLFAEAV